MLKTVMGTEAEFNGDEILFSADDKRRGMVCRDFMRNSCLRGPACKFQHPDAQKKIYSFCHDFQNGECRRSDACRFIHSSREDENYYKRTGELPPHLIPVYENQNRVVPDEKEMCSSPVCKLNLWNECWRENCKYRHMSLSEYRKLRMSSPSPPLLQMPLSEEEEELFHRRRLELEDKRVFEELFEPELKRRRTASLREEQVLSRLNGLSRYESGTMFAARPPKERTIIMLEEENMLLRSRIGDLKKRVDDLQATNEFLLDQNAQLRINDKNTAGLTTVTVPAVTITNTVPGGAQMQQAPTPQQMVNAAIRTVTASVATVPVSIAAVTPVSIAAVSMAPVQQMPPPIVTMAQQGAPPPPDGQQDSLTLPMSISAGSAPLVSYPLMSRAVIQTTDLRH